jgi:hypothetical protein
VIIANLERPLSMCKRLRYPAALGRDAFDRRPGGCDIIPGNAFAQRRSQAASAGPPILGYTAGIRRSILQKIRSPTEGRAMPDELLTIEQFDDKIGQAFALDEADAPAIPLTLTEAKTLRNYANAKRVPFTSEEKQRRDSVSHGERELGVLSRVL